MDVLLGTAGWTGITALEPSQEQNMNLAGTGCGHPWGGALEGPGLTEAWAHSALSVCAALIPGILLTGCAHSSSGGLGQTSGAAPNHPGSSEAGVSGKVTAHIPQLVSGHWLPTSPLQQLHGYALTSPQMIRQWQ